MKKQKMKIYDLVAPNCNPPEWFGLKSGRFYKIVATRDYCGIKQIRVEGVKGWFASIHFKNI